MKIDLVINLKDGKEIYDIHSEIEDLTHLPAELNRIMAAEAINPDLWSSVMITIVNL